MDCQYTPSHVANFFLLAAEEEGRPLSQMKLQKLVYIGYGWIYAVLEAPLFDERFEAWQHGPVIPSLYHEFKHFRADPITGRSVCYNMDTGDLSEPEIPGTDADTRLVLGKVWNIYKMFSASALRNKTHEPGTPWSQTWQGGHGQGDEIPPVVIRDYFRERIETYLNVA